MLCCLLDIPAKTFWIKVDGQDPSPSTGYQPMKWTNIDMGSSAGGFHPAFSMNGNYNVSVNFGRSDFKLRILLE